MTITTNMDAEFVKAMEDALKLNEGHCPCIIEHTEDSRCVCKDFREKIRDTEFEGWCHCGLYHKAK